MKRATILRGLPGSGKSTEAAKLPVNLVCSADDYFIVNGVYCFDPSRIGQAHVACMKSFLIALDEGWDVAVDNTNVRLFELTPYRLAALAKGYEVEIIRVVADAETCAKRNSHGVPLATIQKMAASFEDVPVFLGSESFINNEG